MSTAEERMQNEIDELEQENRLLRARNTRLEAEANAAPTVQEPSEEALARGVMALLQCSYSELEDYSPKLMGAYQDDVKRVFSAMAVQPAPVQEPAVWTATRLWNRRELWNCPADIERDLLESYTTPPAAPVQPVDIATLVEGMEVSIDVSTGEHDSGNRLFGSVTLVQENQGSKHGLILLVQEPEANFKTVTATAQQCKWPTCQSEKYQQSLVKQIEQELVTGITQQWVDLTDRQIESIFLDAGWSWGEKADMYVPAVREVLKLFKEINE